MFGKEFHVFGAAYLNDLTANVLCLTFAIFSIGLLLFNCIFSHVGPLMVMSSCTAGILGLPRHLSASVELEYFGLPSTSLAQMFCITWYLLMVLFGSP